MFYDNVCLKGQRRYLLRFLVSEWNNFEHCDVMTSLVTSPINTQ